MSKQKKKGGEEGKDTVRMWVTKFILNNYVFTEFSLIMENNNYFNIEIQSTFRLKKG